MRYISNVLVSIIIGFSATFIYAFKKSRIASATSEELLSNVKKKVNIEVVGATKIGDIKVYDPIVTYSSGGYGGHSSGGGGHSAGHSAGHSSHSAGHSSHSSGGGGGHRF